MMISYQVPKSSGKRSKRHLCISRLQYKSAHQRLLNRKQGSQHSTYPSPQNPVQQPLTLFTCTEAQWMETRESEPASNILTNFLLQTLAGGLLKSSSNSFKPRSFSFSNRGSLSSPESIRSIICKIHNKTKNIYRNIQLDYTQIKGLKIATIRST